ncbi:hypothetical protein QYE76_015779 [Lolium multiflorum]|uniref:Aminotransferase-like plant mobile domain-containing protein n=1 Tax=Lolium multiflorum TaxID=4521 RepID=A0AAD8U5G7_LOLMU|nr:hypothetical protein QYE76_015779 [Lolium multiflorum]
MAESINANTEISGLKVSDILLPHPSLPNSLCLGPRSTESPDHLISCEANRIPFVNQDLDLSTWADCLRAWPNPPEDWVSWYNRMAKTHQSSWETSGIADALALSLSPLEKHENLLKTIGYFWSDALNCFMFGHGPMTPTILDVVMITGLDIASPSPSAFRLPKSHIPNFPRLAACTFPDATGKEIRCTSYGQALYSLPGSVPHFFLHFLTESRADLPDVLTGQRCYSFFDALVIPIPHGLSFTSSTDDFEAWWAMWKTHAFRRALGPLLKQLDVEYAIPAEQQQDGPEPVHDDGSSFTLHPPAPVVLFCKNSPSLKKVVMQSQPIVPKSASKSGVSSKPAAPRASARTAVRKVAARKTLRHHTPSPAQEIPNTSTEEISSEDTQSGREDSSSGTSRKNTAPSEPDLPPSASKKRSAPEPDSFQASPAVGKGGHRMKSRCMKRARKTPQTSSSDQAFSNTDDTSSGEVKEVTVPSTTLDLTTSNSGAEKAATLVTPSAATREPIASSPVASMVLGEGCDLSTLLTFDPESIEPTAKASEVSGPNDTQGQLQQLKALLSSSIETLVEDTEGIKNILKNLQPHLPVIPQVKLWPVVTLSAYRSRVTLARQRIGLRHAQLPLKADIADKCQQLNEKKAALDTKTNTSTNTAELEVLRKELEDLEERVRVTKQLIQDKEALIARSHEEAEGLKAELKADLAEIRALNKQLVTGQDEDGEAEIAEVDRVRASALCALEAFLQ